MKSSNHDYHAKIEVLVFEVLTMLKGKDDGSISEDKRELVDGAEVNLCICTQSLVEKVFHHSIF